MKEFPYVIFVIVFLYYLFKRNNFLTKLNLSQKVLSIMSYKLNLSKYQVQTMLRILIFSLLRIFLFNKHKLI